jgi:NAD(P)-dependent dehydrogenase (short-subunit alcohol dehydrogenase family)
MGYSIAGKRALVTGASSGIGATVARDLARRGATVGICARREDRLRDVLADCREASPDCRMWVVELSELGEVSELGRRAEAELGGVDILVNNAGMPKRRHVTTLTAEVVDDVMALNYLSPVRLMLALLPHMLERGDGRVVNISSVAARLGPPGEAAYAASKAALTAWSESMAVDLWDTGVRLHVVNPGIIDTELFGLPDNDPLVADIDALPPQAVADAIAEQLDTDIFEIYVPDWFSAIAAEKAKDVGQFLAGSAAWTRQQRLARAASPESEAAGPGGGQGDGTS